MGCGTYSVDTFRSYSESRGRTVRDNVVIDDLNAQAMFTSRTIDEALSPLNVMRESCDSVDHPHSRPVIIALDVTGSMGSTAVEVAKKISKVIAATLDKIDDIQFMVMGIGDLAYDKFPIQISQFESDIRIVEQLDKIYFEGGGGGNDYESYTAAWYMGDKHTRLDCYNKRHEKGIIITIGDEELNPSLPINALHEATGDPLLFSIETKSLYEDVIEKYDVFHIHVLHSLHSERRESKVWHSFTNVIRKDNYKTANLETISDTITDIIVETFNKVAPVYSNAVQTSGGMPIISW